MLISLYSNFFNLDTGRSWTPYDIYSPKGGRCITRNRGVGFGHFLLTGEGDLTGPAIGYCIVRGQTHREVTDKRLWVVRVNTRLPSVKTVRNSLQYPMPFIESVECAAERWCFLIASLRCAQVTQNPGAEAVEERLNLVRRTRHVV